ncbi:MAG: hypothetical protein PWP48_996 [Clostridiales bacterium]|nr:hypothetical protein [Clostridiales bacterium]
MEKDKMAREIISFVSDNKQSYASRAVCGRILGQTGDVDNSTVMQLKSAINNADDNDLQSCYDLIK